MTRGGVERIPSLDGMRAISIALVILSHAQLPLPFIWRFNYGNLGVRIFFVISGFLITKLLIAEHRRTGRINIPQFYLRRAFRILPAAYLYLAIAGILIPFGMHATYTKILPAVLYFANYDFSPSSIATGHFWSLSVEEQFYLLWPAALVLLPLQRAKYACILLLLVAPAFRLLSDTGLWPTNPEYAFESVCDALATGCLLAILRESVYRLKFYRRLIESPSGLAMIMTGILLTSVYVQAPIRDLIGIPVLNVGIAITLDRYSRLSYETTIGRALNAAPLVWLGTVSYSLYLWQQAWMFSSISPVIAICGAMGCATASFYFIERPMLRLRSVISRAASITSEPEARARLS